MVTEPQQRHIPRVTSSAAVMNISLTGKRVLITGAGRGIGRAIAIRVVACGGHAIALSRTQTHLDTLKAECPAVETVTCDLSDWEATRATVEALGPIHCLVNNAGTNVANAFLDIAPSDFDEVMNVNLKAVINVSQVVARGMIARGEGGAIVNISSQNSLRAQQDFAVYCASKAGLDHLTRVMTLELGPKGIRVNCVNPTLVLTDLARRIFPDPAKMDQMLKVNPMRKVAKVEDVVSAVVFLLSDHAALINGVMLPVDGGYCAC